MQGAGPRVERDAVLNLAVIGEAAFKLLNLFTQDKCGLALTGSRQP